MKNQDVCYIQRTRDYYRAQGYTTDYQWACFDEVPFTRPAKSLSQSRIALVTTAMPDNKVPRNLRKVSITPVQPPPVSMYTEHLSWDKKNTHTRDVASFLPIQQLNTLVEAGEVGELNSNFFSVPTEYSQRNTLEADAPEILALCKNDNVDLVLLVPL